MLLKDTERWNKLKTIFDLAADLDPVEADAFLKAECAGDDELLDEARQLLALHLKEGLALDQPPLNGLPPIRKLVDGRVFEPGQLLPGLRFRIVGFLGEGGIGEVYEAEDLELNQRLAIKTLHPLRAAEESTRERFKRELRLARRISHPNVCRIYDFFPGEISFITMELLEGETLGARLKREGPMADAEALQVTRELCAGLDAAHQQKIVHRDLKPSNIMLCEGRAVIMDFGLALLEGRHDAAGATLPTSAMGTPAYMSPEQLEGRRVTVASDLYSLGVVLYEMLTGAPPHAGLSPLAIAARRVQEPPPSPRAVRPEISESWDAAVRHCLEVEPSQRVANPRVLLDEIERRASHWRIPRQLFFGLGVVIALAAVAGLLIWIGALAHQPTAEARRWLRMGDEARAMQSSYAAAQLYEKASKADSQFPLARIRMAEAEIQQDRYERAKDLLLAADPGTRSVRLEWQAAKSLSLRDFPTAMKLYTELVERSEDRAAALLMLSELQAAAGDRKAAVSSASEAARVNPQSAAAWLRLAILEKSTTGFRRAEEIFLLQGNVEGRIEVHRNRAIALTATRPLPEAKAELEQALSLSRTIRSPMLEAQVLFAMSLISSLGGEGDQAIARAKEGRAAANAARLEELSIRGILNLASAQGTQYRLEEMEVLLRDAERQAESIRAHFLLAQVRFTLAQTMSRLSRERKDIEELLTQAEAYYRTNDLRPELFEVMNWFVLMDTAAARYDSARKQAQDIAAWFESIGDTRHALLAGENIAEVDDRTGNLQAALLRYQFLADTYETLELKQKAVYMLANGASAAVHFGDLFVAKARIEKARGILKKLGQPKASSAWMLDLVDAERAVAETRHAEAEVLARGVLERNKGGAPGRDMLANGVLAVCLTATGRVAKGVKLAEDNLTAAIAGKQQYLISQASMRHLQALMHAGRFEDAARAAEALIPWLDERKHRSEEIEAMALLAACRKTGRPQYPQVWAAPELDRFLARLDIQQFTKGRIIQ
jgi:hypothetical protein